MKRLRFAAPAALMACLAVCCIAGNTGPIRKLTLNPEARVVGLFEGEAAGELGLRLVAQSAKAGSVFVTNTTDAPLTVAVPDAVAGIHIHPQLGQGFPFGQAGPGGLGNSSGLGQGLGQSGSGNSLGQGTGGTLSGTGSQGFPGGQNGIGNGNGNGFFSIPAGKTVQLQLNSVCLHYGRPDPTPVMKYKLVSVESQVSSPALRELLAGIGPRSDRDATQAAAWHLANELPWDKIARIPTQPTPGVVRPLFSSADVKAAQQLVADAEQSVADQPAVTAEQPVAKVQRDR